MNSTIDPKAAKLIKVMAVMQDNKHLKSLISSCIIEGEDFYYPLFTEKFTKDDEGGNGTGAHMRKRITTYLCQMRAKVKGEFQFYKTQEEVENYKKWIQLKLSINPAVVELNGNLMACWHVTRVSA